MVEIIDGLVLGISRSDAGGVRAGIPFGCLTNVTTAGDHRIFRDSQGPAECVVCDQQGAAEFFRGDDPQAGFGEDGVVGDGQVSNDCALVVAAVDAVAFGVEDEVVADDGVCCGLNAVVAGVPNHVSFDDVGCLAIGVVNDDAGVVRVVDNVVANDISVAAVLEFDPVALTDRAAFEIMDVVVLDDGIKEVAVVRTVGFVVGAEIKGFAMAAGVVDVVASKSERLVDFPWIVRSYCHTADVMDVEVFQGNEFSEVVALFPNPNGSIPAGNLDVFENQILAAGKIEAVLASIGAFKDDSRASCCPDRNRLCSTATLGDLKAARI